MKNLLLILCLILLASACGKKRKSSPVADVIQAPIAVDIVLSASRTYGPSSWSNGLLTAPATANYEVPERVDIDFGNSGTGWLSLVIGNRRFCFQGNASNNSTANGTAFLLIREKAVVTEDCHTNLHNQPANRIVQISQGTEIRLSIPGGGCSSGACQDTGVELRLIKL